MEQAAHAGDAQHTYITPYIDELEVQFVPRIVETSSGSWVSDLF